jgi:hypothetical protein
VIINDKAGRGRIVSPPLLTGVGTVLKIWKKMKIIPFFQSAKIGRFFQMAKLAHIGH